MRIAERKYMKGQIFGNRSSSLATLHQAWSVT
jgi:hypothetical protein